MDYIKQKWTGYDEGKTLEENNEAGAVVTPERMEHIEEGIAVANELYEAGEVETVESGEPAEVEITEDKKINFKIPAGPAGKSAYDIAVENGFEGSEEEWIASLKGTDGESDSSDKPMNISIKTKTITTDTWTEKDGKLIHMIDDSSITSKSVVVLNTEGSSGYDISSAPAVVDGILTVVANSLPDADVTIRYVVLAEN